jgi:hypothetical protein
LARIVSTAGRKKSQNFLTLQTRTDSYTTRIGMGVGWKKKKKKNEFCKSMRHIASFAVMEFGYETTIFNLEQLEKGNYIKYCIF